ncbi:unnamed protein product [Moneuplotes crassus]|uniref:Uncharacterized protein n=1 Tax=Euplotes crassus TaxID=5936 RepID=A0AAD2D1T4_EUPCR|nr:unnamed protein product [Moneuplotes crassus]
MSVVVAAIATSGSSAASGASTTSGASATSAASGSSATSETSASSASLRSGVVAFLLVSGHSLLVFFYLVFWDWSLITNTVIRRLVLGKKNLKSDNNSLRSVMSSLSSGGNLVQLVESLDSSLKKLNKRHGLFDSSSSSLNVDLFELGLVLLHKVVDISDISTDSGLGCDSDLVLWDGWQIFLSFFHFTL